MPKDGRYPEIAGAIFQGMPKDGRLLLLIVEFAYP